MICSKCHAQGVENEVLGKKFWYCRTCKDEIVESLPEPRDPYEDSYRIPTNGLSTYGKAFKMPPGVLIPIQPPPQAKQPFKVGDAVIWSSGLGSGTGTIVSYDPQNAGWPYVVMDHGLRYCLNFADSELSLAPPNTAPAQSTPQQQPSHQFKPGDKVQWTDQWGQKRKGRVIGYTVDPANPYEVEADNGVRFLSNDVELSALQQVSVTLLPTGTRVRCKRSGKTAVVVNYDPFGDLFEVRRDSDGATAFSSPEYLEEIV